MLDTKKARRLKRRRSGQPNMQFANALANCISNGNKGAVELSMNGLSRGGTISPMEE
jgi:hypothetical protein